MNLVDTHCHLFMEPLSANVPAVLQRADAAGVGTIVVPAYDTTSWPQVAQLASDHAPIRPALGLHPWVADEALDLAQLRDALAVTNVIAIGEIGLDYKIETPGRARQREIFGQQLDLARELDLPVIMHCRGAFDDLIGLLTRHAPGIRGVMHAYSRGPELAQRLVGMGLMLGLGGAITRPRAKQARRSAQVVPRENIVLETDAPAIGLDGVAPEETEPRHVAQVATALAELRGESVETIVEATTRNARELFRI